MLIQRKRSDYQKLVERRAGNTQEVELWADFLCDIIPEDYFNNENATWNIFARRLWGFLIPSETPCDRLFTETMHSLQFYNGFELEDFIEVICWLVNNSEKSSEKIPFAAYMFQLMIKEPRLVEDFKALPIGTGIIDGLTIVNQPTEG